MALDMSEDPSMLRFLNGESNVKGGPNENYGREFVELFTLGVNHVVTGAKNYSENDVAQLASRSPAGTSTTPTRTTSRRCSTPVRRFNGPKSASASSATTTPTASSTWCSARTPHAPYIVKKLWGEFMPTPPPPATLHQLVDRLRRFGP